MKLPPWSAKPFKERIEVVQGQHSTVIDGFRRVMPLPADRMAYGSPSCRQRKCHAALLKRGFEFFDSGDPPIPFERLLETAQATLLAPEALSPGDRSSMVLVGQS